MRQQISIQSHLIHKEVNWSDFFSFRSLITIKVIQVLYFIVAVLITLFGLITLFSTGAALSGLMPGGAFTSILFIVFGNILWRIWCELIVVFFHINSKLSNIDKKT